MKPSRGQVAARAVDRAQEERRAYLREKARAFLRLVPTLGGTAADVRLRAALEAWIDELS